MPDFQKLADQFIAKQERFYNRPVKNISRFLIKDFAKFVERYEARKPTPQVEIKEKFNVRQIKRGKRISNGKLQVAFITEDIGHLTGGRYYCWFIASALIELGYDVTVYTNRKPVFQDYFKNYPQPKVQVVADRSKDLQAIDVQADIYMGSPISGNVAASNLGAKYGKPAFAIIFDPFPMMNKYLGTHNHPNWIPLIKSLRSTDTKIISLCDSTSEYIPQWLNKQPEDVIPIYPCVNSRELNAGKALRGNYAVFISRLVKHKNFDHVLRACKNLNIPLKVISSVDGINADKLVKQMKMEKQVEFLMNIDDRDKFEVIKRARVAINGSMFEGFGMWFIEAITCGTPTVCYDYPTIREIAKKHNVTNVYMAEWNKSKSLEQQLAKAYAEQKFTQPSKAFYFEEMVKEVKKTFTIEPRIGVVTIGLNESKFIQASLRSMIKHPNVKKVAVVEGAVNLYPKADKNGLSTDNMPEKIRQVQSEPNGEKIVYERYGWAKDKSELRNRALMLLGRGITHVLVVDGDEVYMQSDLNNLVTAMRDNPKTGVFLYPFYHFWKRKDLIAVGGQWDSQMFRCFKFADKTLHWGRHELPVIDEKGVLINVSDGKMVLKNVHVYHYGYMKDQDDVQAKLEYYRKRDGHVLKVTDTWTNWKEGMPTQPTHGGGDVAKFNSEHPPELKGII